MQTDWYRQTTDQVLGNLDVDASKGLSSQQAQQRLKEHGPNALKAGKKRTLVQMFFDQLKDFMVLVLVAAAVISGVLGEISDMIIIMVVILLNAVLGVVQENRAEQSLEALRKMSSPHAKVLRDGQVALVEAEDLVPGDIVELETGDLVPADIRLMDVFNLQLQESALTGESHPVEKHADPIDNEVGVGDRVNMAFSSSLVTYGRGKGVVVGTGMQTQIGHIAGMIQGEEGVKTPLQKRLAQLSKTLGYGCLAICAVIFGVGLLYGKQPLEMFMVAISLAVAAIPEGLPATVTVVLAIGVQRMSKKQAIIRRLPAVETLGSATVICSDKTGTLTLNRMTVKQAFAPFEGGDLQAFKHQGAWMLTTTAMVLCNDAQPGQQEGKQVWLGDPTETALLDYGQQLGFERPRMQSRMPRVDEIPFDSDRKLMTTVHQDAQTLRAFVKGAVDEMLPRVTHILDGEVRPITPADKERILGTSAKMADDALRVLAFATREVPELVTQGKRETYEDGLIFLGIVGMIDPARPEVAEAVIKCRRAGIKPVMITGDHPVTATAIARELGILGKKDRVVTGSQLEAMDDEQLRAIVRTVSVYARVSPEHKLRIVRAWQSYGDVVAMTGDGVNDAPALKRADIGVAMGITGTEVSKEASAMILADDDFSTIVTAVEEGRTIYANILKAIQFLLGCNIGEVLTIFVATLLNWDTPLLPVHLLWVNLVTDSLPALALGVDPATPDIMDRPPQDPKTPLFTGPLIYRLIYSGLMLAALTLGAFWIGNASGGAAVGRTMAFATLAFGQMVHVFNIRSNTLSFLKVGLTTNRPLLLAMVGTVVLQLLVMLVPPLQRVFELTTLGGMNWLWVALLSLLPLALVEILKALGLNGEKKRK